MSFWATVAAGYLGAALFAISVGLFLSIEATVLWWRSTKWERDLRRQEKADV
jgi:hypothetical protein